MATWRLLALARGGPAALAGIVLLAAALAVAPARAQVLMPTSQAELIRTLIPSVVNITARAGYRQEPITTQAGTSQADPSYQIMVNAGSGFIIDPSGVIVTNWHVVTDAFEITVTLSDGTHLPARILGAARVVDLALLKVDAGHKLPAVRWGDSSKVEIGDPVLAMGNALGIGMSVSAGIVSALNRNIGDTPVDDFIQTDAAINHGNSGGPLFDLKGEVIGVNSAIISPTAANAGLGFAMPSNDAQFVIQRMINQKEGDRPAWLGASLQGLTPDMVAAMGQPGLHGAIVAWVIKDTPAEQAGMHAGDVIQRFDGKTISDERALLREVTIQKPGDLATFGVWRDGREIELKTTLGQWPKMVWERNAAPPAPNVRLTVPPHLGLSVAPLTDATRPPDPIAPDVHGVLVTEVAPGSDAARRGVAAGDVVLQVGPRPVHTPAELWQALEQERDADREFGLFLVLPKKQPILITRFPGPKWFVLRIATK